MADKIVKFLTSGSVDDGKSTLIGKLLYDTNSLYDDQIAEIRQLSDTEELDYSLFVEGLESERKQKITIDVAYRYFTNENVKFIIADAPGHEEYTRNMSVAAANSDVAVLVIDAKGGIKTQSLRHFYISYLFGIRNFVVVINKMDLVSFSKDRFVEIRDKFLKKVSDLAHDAVISFIPISAKEGDNVAITSNNMPWYDGKHLLRTLIDVNLDRAKEKDVDSRFKVQAVIKHEDKRLYQGATISGKLSVGEEIFIYPAETTAKIAEIIYSGKNVSEVGPGQSAAIILDEDRDIERGSLFSDLKYKPHFSSNFSADIVWFAKQHFSTKESQNYLVQLNNKYVSAEIGGINHVKNINDFSNHNADIIEQNQISNVSIRLAQKVPFDLFTSHKYTGSFLLIDKHTNETLACGLVTNVVTEEVKKKSVPDEFVKELADLVKKYFGEEGADNFINQICKNL